MNQMLLPLYPLEPSSSGLVRVPPPQLLKWVGNKQRSAMLIAALIPEGFRRYFEPFVGAGAVLGTIAPQVGIAGDALRPLCDLWRTLQRAPDVLIQEYEGRWNAYQRDPVRVYEEVRARYNDCPNPHDLLFLCRSCYGGVVRFTKTGTMSTPIGPHKPLAPDTLRERAVVWRERVRGTTFRLADFEETMAEAGDGDVVYCDPPYLFSQSILYGAQAFDPHRLWRAIAGCVDRGAKVLLSLDRSKRSGQVHFKVDLPEGLFRRQLVVPRGASMLRRLQMRGATMESENVTDHLLLTW